jgi:FKBP-type peptidyl-prolyl cis-trans isomerase
MRPIHPISALACALLLTACPSSPSSSTTGAPEPKASSTPVAATPPPTATAEPSAIPAPPDVAAPPADAQKTPSGLASKVLTPGTGKDHPAPEDAVKVHYTGWTKDGKMFDSSVARGEPLGFKVTQVIPGWTEGLQLMVVGEKRRLWIPSKLAYTDHPTMPGAPAGDLVFDVELISIVAGPKPPPVPEDVKAPPKDAKKTPSGLAYKLLKKGTGKDSPKETSYVTVNYSGWQTDGKMFYSSVTRGRPATFGVKGVIKGWTEGLQLMKVGDTMRFWIPRKLAYGDKPGPREPAGDLVFDVELISIR